LQEGSAANQPRGEIEERVMQSIKSQSIKTTKTIPAFDARRTIRRAGLFIGSLVLGAAVLGGAPAQAAQSLAGQGHIVAMMAAAKTSLDGQLNINESTQAQWELLPGIGPATAKKLVGYRAKRKFGDITHVMRIKGIGRKTFSNIKPYLTTSGETDLRVVKHK